MCEERLASTVAYSVGMRRNIWMSKCPQSPYELCLGGRWRPLFAGNSCSYFVTAYIRPGRPFRSIVKAGPVSVTFGEPGSYGFRDETP